MNPDSTLVQSTCAAVSHYSYQAWNFASVIPVYYWISLAVLLGLTMGYRHGTHARQTRVQLLKNSIMRRLRPMRKAAKKAKAAPGDKAAADERLVMQQEEDNKVTRGRFFKKNAMPKGIEPEAAENQRMHNL